MHASERPKPCVHRLEKLRQLGGARWREATDDEWVAPSRAVVASRGGHGIVLWYGGGLSLAFEIEEGGVTGLDDLGLDDAPDGISVWTGRYVTKGAPTVPGFCDDSVETIPSGSFRQPDANEWHDIRMGRNPWPKIRCSKCSLEASRSVIDGSDVNLCERCEHALYCCCDDGSPGAWEGCRQAMRTTDKDRRFGE